MIEWNVITAPFDHAGTLVSQSKKQVRAAFRSAVFGRDGYRCVMCGMVSTPDRAETELDAHHITDRHEMPNGGYVMENGIALCAVCHIKAEATHRNEPIPTGFSRSELYARIGSSLPKAIAASEDQ